MYLLQHSYVALGHLGPHSLHSSVRFGRGAMKAQMGEAALDLVVGRLTRPGLRVTSRPVDGRLRWGVKHSFCVMRCWKRMNPIVNILEL